MTASRTKRPAAIRVVLPFVFRHWLKQPVTAATIAGGMLGATVADLFMPVFSGHLVDAMTRGTSDPAARACGARRVRRHRGARACLADPAHDRPAGDRAVHAADHVRRGARRLHARAALLDRLARQQLRRFDRAQDHPRHVGARPAQRHHPDGAVALARGAAGVDGPARAALVVAGPRDRRGRRDLHSDGGCAFDALHRAGGAGLQRLGHQGRRHAGGRHHLQRGGEIVRRRGARGRAARARRQPLARARAADLAALHLHRRRAARGAACACAPP